jgi:hypothetical protein
MRWSVGAGGRDARQALDLGAQLAPAAEARRPVERAGAATADLGGRGDLEVAEPAVDHRLAQAVEREAHEAGGEHDRRRAAGDDGERERRASRVARQVAQARGNGFTPASRPLVGDDAAVAQRHAARRARRAARCRGWRRRAPCRARG